ncbi:MULTISPECIES: hypothetical protein [Kocuria]|uniref:hypothetical protein n=1 Tax=Kocuria TaxID=57493 RepID=UPI00101CA3ED|nr:hypothetical protein [Kocuria carniphila]
MSRSTTLRRKRPFWLGALVAAVIVSLIITLLSLFAVWWAPNLGIYHYLEVTSEVNLPMWWNVLLLIVAATLMFLVAANTPSRSARLSWRLIAVIALLMSLDDATMLHEKLGLVVERFAPDTGFTFTWVILGAPIAAGVILLAFFASRRLHKTPGRLLVSGFVVFLGAAVGFEFIADYLIRVEAHWFLYRVTYHLEEGLEMVGAALMAVAPLADIQRVYLRGQVTNPTNPEPITD